MKGEGRGKRWTGWMEAAEEETSTRGGEKHISNDDFYARVVKMIEKEITAQSDVEQMDADRTFLFITRPAGWQI